MMNTPEFMEPTENYLEIPDGRIYYLDWGGSGPQAHLLHANGFCAGTYSPFVRYLLDDLHIIASDVRGHGATDLPNLKHIHHWNVFAEDLRILIERTMSPPIVGLGHSLGAVTTYIAASQYPHLFSCIILLDPPIFPRRMLWLIAALKWLGLAGSIPLAIKARRRRTTFEGKKEALERFTSGRGIFKSWSPEFVEAYLECGLLEMDSKKAVLRCDPELEAQVFESIPLDVWKYAKKISCPVLAIRGAKSETFKLDAAKRLKRRIADFELATIADAGHFLPMGKPEACAQVIVEFVKKRISN